MAETNWEIELKRKFFVRNGEGYLQANSSPELFHYLRDFIKQQFIELIKYIHTETEHGALYSEDEIEDLINKFYDRR